MSTTVQDQATAQLGNIPFSTLLGGPLNAAVEAQATAARTSADFITQVAFDQDGNVRSVTFKYEKDGQATNLVVPILTIVPIPYLRIETLDIDFTANISASTSSRDTSEEKSSITAGVSGSASYWFFKVNFNASYSNQKQSNTERNSKYDVQYTMGIKLHAVQDDMPAGMSKVLNILQEAITEKKAA